MYKFFFTFLQKKMAVSPPSFAVAIAIKDNYLIVSLCPLSHTPCLLCQCVPEMYPTKVTEVIDQ